MKPRRRLLLVAGSLLLPISALAAETTPKAVEPPSAGDPLAPSQASRPMGQPEPGQPQPSDRPGATVPSNMTSRDRSQMTPWEAEKQQLQAALQPGQPKGFYRQELDRLGYKVTSVNKDKPDYAEYEIVKGEKSYELQIDVGQGSGRVKKVAIEPNVWKARSTKQEIDKSRPPQAPR